MVDKLVYMDYENIQELSAYLDQPDELHPDWKRFQNGTHIVDWTKNRVWEYVADYWDVL